LEPRLFSFNSPIGACPECDGLGHVTALDAGRVVAFPSLSMAAGAVKGWDRRNPYTYSMLESVAKHFEFDIEMPFEQLPKKVRDVLLLGSRDEEIEFVYQAEGGKGRARTVRRRHSFEGILPNLERRLRETDSVAVREELARYQSVRPCTACQGTRLRPQARHVFMDSSDSGAAGTPTSHKAIFEIERSTLKECLSYFESLQLPGARAEIADRIIREIRARLRFLNDVGLTYLSLDRGADTLSGGEAQRIRLASQIGSGLSGVMYVLDEPSIGLHQRDNARLIDTLRDLRDLGNSVLVVEHDEDMIRAADSCGRLGSGRRCARRPSHPAQGTGRSGGQPSALTGKYLAGALRIAVPGKRHAWSVTRPSCCASSMRGAQPQRRRCRDPGGAVDLRDGRFRLRQEHLGQ
jgi:excinuclease ABC subunit A